MGYYFSSSNIFFILVVWYCTLFHVESLSRLTFVLVLKFFTISPTAIYRQFWVKLPLLFYNEWTIDLIHLWRAWSLSSRMELFYIKRLPCRISEIMPIGAWEITAGSHITAPRSRNPLEGAVHKRSRLVCSTIVPTANRRAGRYSRSIRFAGWGTVSIAFLIRKDVGSASEAGFWWITTRNRMWSVVKPC